MTSPPQTCFCFRIHLLQFWWENNLVHINLTGSDGLNAGDHVPARDCKSSFLLPVVRSLYNLSEQSHNGSLRSCFHCILLSYKYVQTSQRGICKIILYFSYVSTTVADIKVHIVKMYPPVFGPITFTDDTPYSSSSRLPCHIINWQSN